jgi:hypothetical protein
LSYDLPCFISSLTHSIFDAYAALRINVLVSTDASKAPGEVGFGG